MAHRFPDDPLIAETQRDEEWLATATPSQIDQALKRGELADYLNQPPAPEAD